MTVVSINLDSAHPPSYLIKPNPLIRKCINEKLWICPFLNCCYQPRANLPLLANGFYLPYFSYCHSNLTGMFSESYQYAYANLFQLSLLQTNTSLLQGCLYPYRSPFLNSPSCLAIRLPTYQTKSLLKLYRYES